MEQVGVNEAKSLADLKDFTQKFKARAPLPRSILIRQVRHIKPSALILSFPFLFFAVSDRPNSARDACSLALLLSPRRCVLWQSGLNEHW